MNILGGSLENKNTLFRSPIPGNDDSRIRSDQSNVKNSPMLIRLLQDWVILISLVHRYRLWCYQMNAAYKDILHTYAS